MLPWPNWIAQAVLSLIAKKAETRGKAKMPVDFKINDALEALNTIKACRSPHAPSAVMVSLEGLMTSTVADESEWSTAWTKLIGYVLKHKKLPDTFLSCDIEVTKKYSYMLKMQIADPLTDFAAATEAVKVEDDPAGTGTGGSSPAAARQPEGWLSRSPYEGMEY